MSAATLVGVRRDGRPVHAWTLAAPGGIEAEVWDHGALLKSLTVPLRDGRRIEATQTPRDLAGVEADGAHHGVVVIVRPGAPYRRFARYRFEVGR